MITTSERLILRHHRLEDATPIYESYTGDLESAKYLARLPHTDVEQTKRMLQTLSTLESLEQTGRCVWIVEATTEGNAVGMITVVREYESTTVHFGIGAPYRGRGYAVEALALAAKYLVTVGQSKCVCSFTDVENTAAQAALIRARFVLTGKTNKFYPAPQLNGEYRDVFHYQFRPQKN